MALIKCSECGTEVSSNAEKCPKCANPISGRQPQVVIQQVEAKKKTSILTIVAGVMGLCCLFSVIGQADKTPSGASGGGGTPAAPAAVALEVNPSTLVRDYDGNEVAADLKYKGKILRVTGTVDDIRKDIMDNMFITLSSGHVMRQVQVTFEDSQIQRVASLSKGSRVTIQGECVGLMMNVLINDAVFVD